MNRLQGFAAVLATLTLLWRESCENPALFCYRIGREFVARDLDGAAADLSGNEDAWLSGSSRPFTSSTTSRD